MSELKGKTLLVTGGAGAIGSHVVRELLTHHPASVIVLDNLSSGYLWNLPSDPRMRFVKGDIRSDEDLRHVFRAKPSHVFHLAAFFANQQSVDYPMRDAEVNVIGTLRLLEHAVLAGGLERFVLTNSEGGAYGHNNALPYREEETSLHLGSPYYITKHVGEMFCNFYQAHYGLPTTVLRLFNSYGPGEVPGQYRNVIPNFIHWAKKGRPLPLTGSSEIGRDFVYAGDIAKAVALAAVSPKAIGEAINVASGEVVRIHALAATINRMTGNSAGVVQMPMRKWDQRPHIWGSPAKALDLLGWKPTVSMEEGLRQTLSWFDEHHTAIEAAADFPPGMSAAVPGFGGK
jgi:nucleoside-diphosphate-sugar epimerase